MRSLLAEFLSVYLIMAIKVKDILERVKLISLNQGGAYFNTQGQDSSVILRVKEDHDGAGASGSSVSAINLVRL